MYRALSEHRTRKKKLGDFSQERPSVTKNIKDIQVEKNGTITSIFFLILKNYIFQIFQDLYRLLT